MKSGGFEIWGYDVSLSHLYDNISDAASAVYDNVVKPAYDNVIAPAGRGIAWAAKANYDFYSEIPNDPARIIVAIPVVNIAAFSMTMLAGCGKKTEGPPPDAQDAAPPPPPPPLPRFPNYTENREYYEKVYNYIKENVNINPAYSYFTDENIIEPCLTMTQGIFELICYGVYKGKIPGIEDDKISSCGSWYVPYVSPQTCGNDIQFVDNEKHTFGTSKPEVAYVAQMLGLPPDLSGFPAITKVRHELRMAASDYGISVKLAFENPDASNWTTFQPKLVEELGNYFAQRSQDACFVITNEEQDLFNRIKMINSNPDNFTSPWEEVNKKSTAEVARGNDWMTPLLTAGSIMQMMMDYSNKKISEALEKVKSGDWKIITKKENGKDVKYIKLGREANAPVMKLVEYLNNGIWTSAVPAKDKAGILARAEAAYQTARSRCPECMPDIDNSSVVNCLKAIRPEDVNALEPGRLVAWQIVQIRDGLFGEQGAERFAAGRRGGRRRGGGGGGETEGCKKWRSPTPNEILNGATGRICVE